MSLSTPAVCARCGKEWALGDCVTYSCVDVFGRDGPGFYEDGYMCPECARKFVKFLKGAKQ